MLCWASACDASVPHSLPHFPNACRNSDVTRERLRRLTSEELATYEALLTKVMGEEAPVEVLLPIR